MDKQKLSRVFWRVIDFLALIIVLSTMFQKISSYNVNFSTWLKNKELSYQTDVFLSKAMKPFGKKILIVTFHLNDAGAPLMFLSLAESLHQRGYNVSIVSYAGGRHEKDLKKAHIPYFVSKEFFDQAPLREKVLKPFDMVISGRIPQIYSPSQEYKFVWWDHGLVDCVPMDILEGPMTKDEAFLNNIKFLMYKAQDVVFVSDLQTKKLESCRHLPSEVIPNGIKPTHTSFNDPVIKKMQKAKKNGKIVFTMVGSIDIIKAPDILVNAVKLLGEEYLKKAVFFVVGSGKNEQYANFLHKKSKDFPQIVWAGAVPHEKIGGVYESADVLLVPSRSDTAPLVVQEAAEHYTPSVITDNVGSTFIVKDGQSGFIIPIENPKGLAEKIRFFIDNPNKIKEFGQASRQNYEAYSSYEGFVAAWENKIKRKFKELKNKK